VLGARVTRRRSQRRAHREVNEEKLTVAIRRVQFEKGGYTGGGGGLLQELSPESLGGRPKFKVRERKKKSTEEEKGLLLTTSKRKTGRRMGNERLARMR